MRLPTLCGLVAVAIAACGRPMLLDERAGGDAPATAGPVDARETSGRDAGPEDAGPGRCTSQAERCSGGDDAGQPVDAGQPIDAGAAVDAGVLTWARDTQPIFMRHCTRCHEGGHLGIPSFADRYDALVGPSALCPNETVGGCVGRVVRAQGLEGSACRTWAVPEFHRPSFSCLSTGDVATITTWLAQGMLER